MFSVSKVSVQGCDLVHFATMGLITITTSLSVQDDMEELPGTWWFLRENCLRVCKMVMKQLERDTSLLLLFLAGRHTYTSGWQLH